MDVQSNWFIADEDGVLADGTRPRLHKAIRSCALTSAVVEDPCLIADEWRQLSSEGCGLTFYQSERWCRSWLAGCRASGVREAARIVTVREAGRLVLVWPLVLWHVGPARILRPLGAPATQYADVLIDPATNVDAALQLAVQAISAMPGIDAVLLKGVRADSALARHRFPAHLSLRIKPRDEAPCLRLPSAAPGEARPPLRSGKSLNALRRHERRLAEHGALTYESVEGAAQVPALKASLALKAKWLKARDTISAGYLHPANAAVLLSLAEDGGFRMFRLLVGGELCASEFGILHRGRYISMVQTYDERFSTHSPGRLLLLHIFQSEAADITLFDFMPPDAAHKAEWANGTVAIFDYAFAITPLGRLALAYLGRVRPFLVRCFLALPGPVRDRIGQLSMVRNG
ncbi:GNAT family N-acetyltransferase [Fulvimarina sp. 2208YS6-2-32]|uniref:GNAT family N-acetyltransferase n=1 Tax=Fulvimarina uroteuthidis TaxID=3098149 RepID=A0ABU5I0P7_9HYPH|nr:GNAT family N-acetyltransferase [Fulvimarina sp. 2208YS6-2-32]MDY8108791.1 GNAT family N-acetyltransferase [Fulvimarina sp. 2208YS6-2-32]